MIMNFIERSACWQSVLVYFMIFLQILLYEKDERMGNAGD